MAFRHLARTSLTAVPRRARALAHDINAPEHQASVDLWKKISYGMVGFTGLVTIYVMGKVLTGEHSHHHPPHYPYLKIRTKAYPWADSDCNLFDLDCKAKAAAAAKASH